MIFDDFMNNAEFASSSIRIKDASKARACYNFLRAAVMDSHIPVHKIIGFTNSYTFPMHNIGGKRYGRDMREGQCKRELALGDRIAITRDMALAECNFDLNEKFLHMVFKRHPFPFIMTDFGGNGPIPCTEFQFPYQQAVDGTYNFSSIVVEDQPPDFIQPEDYCSPDKSEWMTCLGNSTEFQIFLWLVEGTGYVDAHDTFMMLPARRSIHLAPKDWWPFDQNFTLNEFVYILPMLGETDTIRIRFDYDMDMKFFKERLQNWYMEYKENKLNDKEYEWLKRFN